MRKGARGAGHRSPGGGGQTAQADPQAEEALAMVERAGRCRSRSPLEGVLPPVRPRTYDPLPEANPRLDRSPIQAPRAGRPMDLAGALSLRAAETSARHRRRPEAAVGATATAPAADPDPRVEEFRDTPGERGHSSGASETVRQVPRASERQSHRAGPTPSGAQNCRLSKPPKLGLRLMLGSEVLGQPVLLKRQAAETVWKFKI